MDRNPALTDTMIVDLNKVVEDRDVDSDELRKLAADPFDAIIMANTFEFLTNPREVLRSAWQLLKPGGTMFIVFSGSDGPTTQKFSRATTKGWRDYNDDQHMWVCGSLFEFSAGEGWEHLLGFDISPDSARDMSTGTGPLDKLMNQGGKNNNLFVVQARKGVQTEQLDENNLEKSINSKMWMIPRLIRCIETAEASTRSTVLAAVEKNVQYLPKIYEALIKMDQFAFTFSMQAQLAADLISNLEFEGKEEQIIALKQGKSIFVS